MQDLVNTVDLECDADQLRTPEELTVWAGAQDIEAGVFDAAGLAEVLALREALRDVCSAHAGAADVAPEALERLNAILARGTLRLVADADGGTSVQPAPGLTGVPALTARVAAAVATATADGTWPRLKACASDTCRWAYYDRSPAGRSRWCTMAICGSRAKMRTYRRGKAAGRGGPGSGRTTGGAAASR